MVSEAWKPVWGGGQVHTWELCRRLIKDHGCEIDLYVRALKDKNGETFPRSESHFGGKLRVVRMGNPSRFGAMLPRLWWTFVTSRVIKKKDYDVIHAHAFLAGIPARRLAHRLKKPLVYTVHGSTLLSPFSWNPLTWPTRFMERLLVTKIPYDVEISVSHSLTKLHFKAKRVVVVPNGVDLALFHPPQNSRESGPFNLLYVGRFDSVKCVDRLIEAFASLRSIHPDATLELVGSGSLHDSLRKKVRHLGLEKVIIFPGFLEGAALLAAYHRASALVLNSSSEGLPLTLFEAWATKTPVIMTRVGDIPHYVTHETTGYLIPPNDHDALVGGLIYLADHSSERRRWAESAYEQVKSCDWDSMTGKTFEIYENLVK